MRLGDFATVQANSVGAAVRPVCWLQRDSVWLLVPPWSFVQMLPDFLLGAKPILFRSSDWTAALLPMLVRKARNLLVFRIGLSDLVWNFEFHFIKIAFNFILRTRVHLSSPCH
jgi:hypothetical protein